MKKLKLVFLFAMLISAASFGQCPAPTVVSAQAKGQHKFIIKVANPAPKHYFQVEWSHTGTAPFTLVKCQGTWNDRDHTVEIEIIDAASPGYEYYGIQTGDYVIVREHCSSGISTLAGCIGDTNVGDPTAPIQVTFH